MLCITYKTKRFSFKSEHVVHIGGAYKDRLACSVTVRILDFILLLSLKYLSIKQVRPKICMCCYVFLSDESFLT